MSKALFRLLCVAALTGMAGIGEAAAQGAPPIKIGEINSYTGPIAAFTLVYQKGLNLAIEQINANGGVLGRKLEVIYRDDNFSAADAVRVANELVLNQKVDLLAGTYLSPIGLAVASYAQQNKVLFVATEPLTNQITWEKGSRYVFRVQNPVSQTAAVFVKKAAAMDCMRWAGIGPISEAISDMNNDFKAGIVKAKPGATWVGEQSYPLGKLNAGAAIDYLQRVNADCVLGAPVGPDLVSLLREGRARGWLDKVKFIGLQSGLPEWLDTMSEADAPVGWIVSGYPWQTFDVPAHKKFVADYQAKYGTHPGYGSLIGYLSGQAIAAGIAHTGSTDTEKMVQGFRGADFDSIVGHIKWRKDHQLELGTFVGTIAVKDGKVVMVDSTYSGTDGLPTEEEGLKRRPPGAND
jgi:branched-chain amino acid transport system substrate-binding protein